MTKRLGLLLAVLALSALPAAAQTTITTTTLTNAITAPSPTSFDIVVGSATGMAANGILYIDGSVYRILAVSGTTITVINQYMPATHNASVTIYVVPIGAQIGPTNPVGSCIRSTAGRFPAYSPYTLMFNLSTGDVAACRVQSGGTFLWVLTNPYAVGAPSAAPPQTR